MGSETCSIDIGFFSDYLCLCKFYTKSWKELDFSCIFGALLA